ncbi:glycosyltransferase [Flagellimonas sp.]|uniref:glycosyltransferase n=1 Tax=Flagellimonas sp. TaxID=2058762 RepID=UPI003B507769
MNKKLLIIGYVWPEPVTTAAGHRMMQLIHAFKSFGYQITFGSTSSKTDFSADLAALDIDCVSLKLNHPSFDAFVQQLKPAIVMFDRFMVEEQFGWRVAEFVPNALRILNTEDLHSLRKTRETCHKKGVEWTVDEWLASDMTKREVASIYRSDLTLMISTYEMDLLTKKLDIPDQILLHLPFLMKKIGPEEQQEWLGFHERQDFISYGNGKHAPNVDSIKYLKESIWPLIRKALPEVKLKIYGAYLPQQILQMHNPKDGFHIEGWVDNLDQEIRKSRICLAPLQFGAGIKGKLVDAMRNGTPNVTTKVGAESMHGELDWSGGIAYDPNAFANEAISLYQNKEQWKKAQSNGIQILNTVYNEKVLLDRLMHKLEAILLDLSTHRNQNYIGQLLQHQTLASTKYMSKWIEEKNRKR